MIIRDFDITPCTMRKEDPTWRFALAASPVTDGHVLRIATDDGHRGLRLRLRHAAHGLDQGHARGRARTVPSAGAGPGPAQHRGDPGRARPGAARRPAGEGRDRLRAARAHGACARRSAQCAVRRAGARPAADPAHPRHQDADRDGGGGAEARRQGLPLPEDQGARRGRGGRRARRGDPQAGRRRRASHHRRQPVLHHQGRHRGAQPHGRASHRPVRAAGRMPTISRASRWSPAPCR